MNMSIYKIPQIIEIITIDQKLHAKLLSSSCPFPLPEWFLKGRIAARKEN